MLLSDYVQAIRRGWVIIVVSVLLALAGAAAVELRKPDVYTASTQLFVASAVPTDDPEELYQRNLIAEQRVGSYVSVISGDVVAGRVAEELGSDLGASVLVSAVPDTVVLQVTTTGSDPERVAEVARAYAEVAPQVIEEVDQVDGSGSQVRVTVVDVADVPSAPAPGSPIMLLIAASILGLGVGITIVIVREVLRRENAERARDADNVPA